MSIENLVIASEYIQAYEYSNPESTFAEELKVERSSDDVLGYYAQLVELGDLLRSPKAGLRPSLLYSNTVSSNNILEHSEKLFNIQCGKNEIVNIDSGIVVNLVTVLRDWLSD